MDFSAIIAALADLQAKLADVSAFAKEQYDKGFADGVASVVVDPEKKFSQADLDAAVSAAVAPLSEQIAAMQAQLDGVPQMVKDAVLAENARIMQIVKDEELDLEGKLALPQP